MPTDQTFHVRDDDKGATVAAALRKWLKDSLPWSRIERLVQSRHVLVNGNLCTDAARRLKSGDVVKLLEHSLAPPAREDDIKVRFIDTQVIVIEKPSGMTSVRHAEEENWSAKRRRASPTLEDLLPRIIAKKTGSRGRNHPRASPQPTRLPPVRPVHRLDRETSGLMIFARTVPAERALGMQFRKHTTGRRYLAVVVGRVEAQTIETQLVRDRGDGRRGSTQFADQGKNAVTHVRPVEFFEGYTLVECELETGRTHQIRIHLSELGNPVCGEKVYNKRKFKDASVDRSGAPRLALHATELAFEHPTSGERMEFEMPLPRDLREFVERLRSMTKKAKQVHHRGTETPRGKEESE